MITKPNLQKALDFIHAEADMQPLLISRPIQISETGYIVYVVSHINDSKKRVRGTKLELWCRRFDNNVFMPGPEHIGYGYTTGSWHKRAAQLMASV